MEAKDDELQTNVGAARCSIWGMELVRTGRCWAPLGNAGHICANFATCSWEPLTMNKSANKRIMVQPILVTFNKPFPSIMPRPKYFFKK